jgi:hypothetical protein
MPDGCACDPAQISSQGRRQDIVDILLVDLFSSNRSIVKRAYLKVAKHKILSSTSCARKRRFFSALIAFDVTSSAKGSRLFALAEVKLHEIFDEHLDVKRQ